MCVYLGYPRGAGPTTERQDKMYKALSVKELRTIAKKANVIVHIERRGTGVAHVYVTSENDANIFNQELNKHDHQLNREVMWFPNGVVPTTIKFRVSAKAGN